MHLAVVAWRGLAARPGRTLLTVAALAIGVAAFTATLLAADAAQQAVSRAGAELLGRGELRVRALRDDGLSTRALDALRSLPGVRLAAPVAERRLTVTTAPGPNEQVFSLLVMGIDPELDPRVRPPQLVAGGALRPDHVADVLVNDGWASAHGLGLGDELRLTGRLPSAPPLRIRGLLADTGLAALDGGEVAIMARAALDASFGTPAPIAAVDLDVAAGRLSEVERALPTAVREPHVAETPDAAAGVLSRARADFAGLGLLFALVSLLVGGFVVGSCIAMTLAENTREVGLLRAAGASARQLSGIVLRQSAVIALAGSVGGALGGVLLAGALVGAVGSTRAAIVDEPAVRWELLGVPIALGVFAAMASGLVPARAAGRMAPVEALGRRAVARRRIGGVLLWLIPMEAAVLVVGLASYPLGPGSLPVSAAVAVLGILVAGAVVASTAVAPLGRALGRPLDLLFGREALIGRANLGRDRVRTGLTAGALGIALGAVVALGALAAGAQSATERWVASVLPGGAAIRLGLPLEIEQIRPAMEAVTGVRTASPIVETPAFLAADESELPVAVAGIDPSVFQDAGALIFSQGRRAAAFQALRDGGSVLLPEALAQRLGVSVGDEVRLGPDDRRLRAYRVAGLVAYSVPARTTDGAVLVSLADAAERLGATRAALWTLTPQAGVAPNAFAAAASEAAAGLAAEVVTPSELAEGLARSLDRLGGVFAGLALVSVLVAALGIVNTLAVGVRERFAEIAMLRANGMTAGQVQGAVVAEAATLGLIGSAVAIVLGLAVAAIALGSGAFGPVEGLPVPVPILLAVVVAGPAVSALAAVFPAHMAGRVRMVDHLKRHQ